MHFTNFKRTHSLLLDSPFPVNIDRREKTVENRVKQRIQFSRHRHSINWLVSFSSFLPQTSGRWNSLSPAAPPSHRKKMVMNARWRKSAREREKEIKWQRSHMHLFDNVNYYSWKREDKFLLSPHVKMKAIKVIWERRRGDLLKVCPAASMKRDQMSQWTSHCFSSEFQLRVLADQANVISSWSVNCLCKSL